MENTNMFGRRGTERDVCLNSLQSEESERAWHDAGMEGGSGRIGIGSKDKVECPSVRIEVIYGNGRGPMRFKTNRAELLWWSSLAPTGLRPNANASTEG
jgi:hypothetical protein